MFNVVAFRFVSIRVMSCMASAFVVVHCTIMNLITLLISSYVCMQFLKSCSFASIGKRFLVMYH